MLPCLSCGRAHRNATNSELFHSLSEFIDLHDDNRAPSWVLRYLEKEGYAL